MKERENQNQFFCIAHNFFGFDMFFLIKGIRLSVWGTKYVNIGRTGLTNINFASNLLALYMKLKKHELKNLQFSF